MSRRPLAIGRSLLVVLLAGAVGGCVNRDINDLERYVDEVKSRKQGEIEPLPEIKQIETFAYREDNRRNPFQPTEQERTEEQAQQLNGLAPDPNRRKEELESYSLDSLRMVGTLERDETTWALVRTKDKTIYRVKAGNYMGHNHGQITRIDENDIELTEIIPNGQGGFRERQASLALKD